jgi:type I restriction enzyme R subunit
MLKGMCSKENFMDIFENFILFDDSSNKLIKIVARNHQFLGVNRAIENVKNREQLNGQLGVFWHTQGSGKSYSIVFFTQKVHRKLTGNFTFLVVTDREDLDKQIYRTFAGSGIVDNDKEKCRASSGKDLKLLLETDKRFIFTMIHKFNQDVDPNEPYSTRNDIIVI